MMFFDFQQISARDRYKLLVSTVVPRPIAWVVTQDDAGRLNAAPFSFFNVFSDEPPLMMIGIDRKPDGQEKDTAVNIRANGEFVVNLVSAENANAMNVTAINFPHGVDELVQAGLTTQPSTTIRPPRIAESPVALECERFQTIQVSNHRTLVMGRVLAMHIRDDAVLNQAKCYVDTRKLDLIGRMHGAGGYVTTREYFEVERIDAADWVTKT
jgi:flavin reductase (DIM6/NTAB) family NADH-FMN oxidoreductase RutF